MSDVQAIPAGYAAVLPYLVIKNAAAALDFYQKAFGAETIMRMNMPSGAVMHAEMRIGGAVFMLSEQSDEWGTKSPDMLGSSPVTLMVYVPDVDAFVERAAAAGATVTMPVSDQFWGDRSGCLQDPFGHLWMISTHIEDVSEEEMAKRSAQMFGPH
ncbi:VOC family protein [Rheinheimera sp. 1928-s]|uniref:VOC family protein n=1 Tax=Rheinheimera sp. 1928-s TaxID=3033803 RepID=UPI00262817E8|nr:VOC family protein [Rheinheimera sp. 1928-s]MDF3126787.1 VOC family protein [Rheinheimera sp. 1928-s]